ncbi:MAG: acyl carrier protein [Desulfovibrionaceae bacterium]|nr:acyl carrier protein [Desulfovibrionaceae bacterium]
MQRSEIENTVNQALAEEFELEIENMHPESLIRDDLGLDSLDIVDMVIVLERAFNFKLTEREKIAHITCLKDIYDFIEELHDKALAQN